MNIKQTYFFGWLQNAQIIRQKSPDESQLLKTKQKSLAKVGSVQLIFFI